MPKKLELIGNIYDAALDPSLWGIVTAQIAAYCGGERVMLATTDTLHPHDNFHFTYRISEEEIATWRKGLDAEEVELHNKWIASTTPGVAISSDSYFGGPEQYLAKGGAFVEMLNAIGIRRQLIVSFQRDHFRLSGVGLNNHDPFPPYAAQHLELIAPHLRRALEIYRHMVGLSLENKGLYELLELMSTGVILLDSNNRVRYTTQPARQMIINNGRLLIRQGTLYLPDMSQQLHLQSLITDAINVTLRKPSSAAGGVIGIKGVAGEGLTLSIVPLSSLAAYQELQSDKIAVAIFISPIGQHVQLPASALADLYELTVRELQLCQAFVNEADIEKVAIALGLKLSSARSLLKSIYTKTSQNSQAGLMKLLMESRLNFRHY